MNPAQKPLAFFPLQGLLPFQDLERPSAPPVALPTGVMGDAYAQAQARVVAEPTAPPPVTTALDQRQVALPASQPAASTGPVKDDRKAASRKHKRSAEDSESDRPACVSEPVYKAAKAAATLLDSNANLQADRIAGHEKMLGIVLDTGRKGRTMADGFLAAFPNRADTRLCPQAELALPRLLQPLLVSQACTDQELVDALDLVRRLPAEERLGRTWDVSDMAMALLPLAHVVRDADRARLARVVVQLALQCPDKKAQGMRDAARACLLADLDDPRWVIERRIRCCLSLAMQGQGSEATAVSAIEENFRVARQTGVA